MPHDDPPLLTLLLGVELSVHRSVEHCERLRVFLFIPLQRHDKFDRLVDLEGAYWVLLCAPLGLKLDFDQWVPIADVGELSHLFFGHRQKLAPEVVLHVHEVADLLDTGF